MRHYLDGRANETEQGIFSKNKEILFLFLIALALRMFLVLTARGIANDGCSYGWLAKDIAGGNFHEMFISIWPPLFPLFAAGASYIFQDIEFSARMVSCLFGSLTVFPLFFLVKNIFDKKIALTTVVFFIVHPYLSQASGEVLTESLYYFFVTSIAFLGWVAIQKKRCSLFLVIGLLLVLAFLTRFEGLTLLFLIFGWIWLTNLHNIRTEIRWKFISSLFCLAMFIVALFPYLFFVHQETGKWQICPRQGKYEDTFLGSADCEQTSFQKTSAVLKTRISYFAPKIPFFFARAYYPVFWVPFFFGVIGRKRFKGFKIGEAYILSFILFRITMLLLIGGINTRYLFAFIPIALCWAGTGFWEIDYRLQEKFKDKSLTVGRSEINRFSIIILAVIIAISLPRALRPIRKHRAIQKEVGYWLKENVGKKELVIIAASPQESFYAGAKWYNLVEKTYTEVINNARQKKADFIITSKDIDEICPDFRDSIRADDLEIFTNKFEKSHRKIVIYKLKKQPIAIK